MEARIQGIKKYLEKKLSKFLRNLEFYLKTEYERILL